MKKALHVLLVLLLILSPWQSYAHGSCDDSLDSVTTQALDANPVAQNGDQSSDDAPCGDDCSCCGFPCMQHCAAAGHAIGAAYDGLIAKNLAALWRSAVPQHYFSVILPTDTRPPQIPA